jgi:hypothetical protein
MKWWEVFDWNKWNEKKWKVRVKMKMKIKYNFIFIEGDGNKNNEKKLEFFKNNIIFLFIIY